MKELLQRALDDAYTLLEKQVPETKKKTESKSILDIKPIDLIAFMKTNNIPDTAWFSGNDNGYDGWDDIVLSWEVDIPTTLEDKLKFKKQRFTGIAWKFVYDILTRSGYTRVGFNSGLLKQFDDTTVYDMYMKSDFDRLIKYYSLPFIKE